MSKLQEKPSPLKTDQDHPAHKKNEIYYSMFVGSGSGYGSRDPIESGSDQIRIRIRIHNTAGNNCIYQWVISR